MSAVVACGPPSMVVPAGMNEPVVATIEGALEEGDDIAATPVAMSSTPVMLSFAAGELSIATTTSVLQRSATSGTWAAIPVGAPGEEMSTGPVRFVWRRGTSSLWVIAESGLFHLREGRLLKSGLSKDLSNIRVQSIDSYGEGAEEELWLTTAEGVRHVKASLMRSVEIEFPKLGALGIPSLAIGAGPGQAVLVAKEQVFFVDLAANKVSWIAKDIGALKAWTRTDDGAVMLATTTGLYHRARSNEVTRRTLAPARGADLVIDDVVSALGTVLISAGGKVARLEGSSFKAFGAIASPSARGLQVDAAGDTFALDGTALVKFATGRPFSFATDVKPFLTAHCNTCHVGGTQGAPVIDFGAYAVTKSLAATITKRLKAEGIAPMPPANTEVLSAADYAVVLKWVAGGMQP